MRLMTVWYSISTPFYSLQVSTAVQSMVPWTIDVKGLRATAGGTPYLLAIRRSLASAWRVFAIRLFRFSAKDSVEFSQIPSHRVAAGANLTDWPPTRMVLSQRWCFLLLEKRIASVFDVSKRTALLSAH